MTRIRYTNVEGVLISKPVIAGTEVLTVFIDLNNLTMDIRSANNQTVTNGNAATVAKLKGMAKKELKSLGVIFNDEVRRRTDNHTDPTTTNAHPI
jgi:hypothetical protein